MCLDWLQVSRGHPVVAADWSHLRIPSILRRQVGHWGLYTPVTKGSFPLFFTHIPTKSFLITTPTSENFNLRMASTILVCGSSLLSGSLVSIAMIFCQPSVVPNRFFLLLLYWFLYWPNRDRALRHRCTKTLLDRVHTTAPARWPGNGSPLVSFNANAWRPHRTCCLMAPAQSTQSQHRRRETTQPTQLYGVVRHDGKRPFS